MKKIFFLIIGFNVVAFLLSWTFNHINAWVAIIGLIILVALGVVGGDAYNKTKNKS